MNLTSPVQVRLDWRAYWQRFKEVHGNDPVPFKGRLLFPDGWTYSNSSHAGPEWPPPDDPEELRKLLLAYWLIRRKVCLNERDHLFNLIQQLKESQRQRSAPLQQRLVMTLEGEDGKQRKKFSFGDVNPEQLEAEGGRLWWLRQDVQDCESRIEELKLSREPEAIDA
jgi:hypothetical protein